MHALNKDIIKEYLDSELQKGLKIKFTYDPKLNVVQPIKIENNAVDQSKQACQSNLKKSSVHVTVENKTVEEPLCDRGSTSFKCISRSLKTSRGVSKSPLVRHSSLSPSNCKDLNKYNPNTRSDTNIIGRLSKNIHQVKQGTAQTCMVMGGNGDGPFRRHRRKHKESVYVLVNNKHETYQNTRFKRDMKFTNEKCMTEKHKGNKTNIATQCNYKAKQRNVFSKIQGTSNKYRATLKQMLEKPNTKDNIIGPIPIRAEGINELTKRIEQLVQESGDGVVQKKLRLCKQGANSSASCLELDVNIRKISFEDIVPSDGAKQKARSIFSPFNCFSARSDSEDHIEKCLKKRASKPKRTLSKISMTHDEKAKTSWRMNIPFFEKFRLNSKNCSVKVLKCGPVPRRDDHCGARVCSSRSQSKRAVKLTTSNTSSGSLEMSVSNQSTTLRHEKGLSRQRKSSVGCSNKSRGTNNLRRYSRNHSVNFELNFSRPAESEMSEKVKTENTFDSHRARLVTTLSPVVCREIYLTPTDCDEIGFNNEKTTDISLALQKHDNSCKLEKPNFGLLTVSILSNRKDNCALYRWTASLRYLFGRFLDCSFQKAFEARINFIDPRELEKRITKKFEVYEKFVESSFILRKTNLSKYLTLEAAQCLPKIFSGKDIKFEPFHFHVIDMSVHLSEHDMTYFFNQLTFKSAENQERTSLCEKELKSVFYNNSNVKSKKVIKPIQKKGTAGTPKHINNYTVNNHTPKFQKLKKVLPKWPRSNLPPSSLSKGAGGDKVSTPVGETTNGKPVIEPRVVNNRNQLNQSNKTNKVNKIKRPVVTNTPTTVKQPVIKTNTTSNENKSRQIDIRKNAMSSGCKRKLSLLTDTPYSVNIVKQPIIKTLTSSIGSKPRQSVATNTPTDANKSNQYFIGTNIITINDTNTKQSIIESNNKANNNKKLNRFVAKSFTNARFIESKKVKRYVIETNVSNVNQGNELDIKTCTKSNNNKMKQSVIETMGLTNASKLKRYVIETNTMGYTNGTKQCVTHEDIMENCNNLNYSVGTNANKDVTIPTTGLAVPNVFTVSMEKPISRNKRTPNDIAKRLNSRKKEILKKLGKLKKETVGDQQYPFSKAPSDPEVGG
ncbi:hypothetical protein WDU94_015261 [Cyamophila willieti]